MENILQVNNTKIINFGKDSPEIANEFYHQFIELYLDSLEINGCFGYENEFVTIDNNDIVIDCGANMGLFSNWAASKGGKVYAFEPGKTAFSLLKKNAALYKENINIYQYGVNDETKNESYTECINIGGSHLSKYCLNYQAGFKERYNVYSICLDDFFSEQKINFIKIDCEGAEEDILYGAKNIISKHSPKIVMACYHYKNDNQKLSEVLLSINPNYIIKEEKNKLFCWVKGCNKND